jgi:cytoskeleton protein RodZ
MTSVGIILKTERERQGRTTAEIAEELCITQRYLRAIEQNDLQSLPGAFFYKSFVKQYAALLGVDEMRLHPGIASLTAQLEPLPLPGADPRYISGYSTANSHAANGNHFATDPDRAPVRDLDPIVRADNRRYVPDGRIGFSLAGLAAVLLICSGFYAWWTRAPLAAATRAEMRQDSPSPLTKPAPAPMTAPVAEAKLAEPDKPAPAALNVSSTTGPDGENHVVLNLSATEKTWISIVSDGKQIFSGILEPSQTKTLTGADVAKLRIGNAGGLEIRWNGKTIGPVGPRGQVRVVVFTPENFEILPGSPTL